MSASTHAPTGIVLAHGPLREGVAAALTAFVYQHGGDIVYHEQFIDHAERRYFTRLEWSLARFAIPRGQLAGRLRSDVAGPFGLDATVSFSDDVPRVAVLVSTLASCLYDILARWRSGEWRVEIPLVVGNHADLGDDVRRFGVAFHHLPVAPETKAAQERALQELLAEERIDLIVLARYMQVLGPELVAAYPERIINIHHAFLPAFPGARPYHAAYRRGVKLIGATSHYVTSELDAGPIIEQDVVRVTHATTVEEMIRLGRDLEKLVLARAVWAHLQRKVIVHAGRTIVFP